MGKRERSDIPAWWTEIVQEIVSQGGFVHSSLEFSERDRELAVNKQLPAETVLLRIPRSRLISLGNSIALVPSIGQVKVSLVDHSELHFPATDVLVAYFLASHAPNYYIKTLPHRSAWDALPRRWSDDQIENYLKGSPLLSRAKRDKRGVRSDFDILSKLWSGGDKPSFSDFDDMLAAVSSRAFADSRDDVVMIPILDLCNHSRGCGDKKNLTYATLEDDSIEVKTSHTIEPYQGLRVTYGAQGNAQLLSNYGFSIPENIEPDGSSNDVLEFSCDERMQIVSNLRTGPKAYAYGGFVKALEQTFDERNSSLPPDEDDMEAFLNECDTSQEIDVYSPTIEDEEEPECDTDKEAIHEQLEALQRLRAILLKRMEAYDCMGQKMRERLDSPNDSIGYYSALLLQSEQRCLYFFLRAAQKVESKLLEKEFSESEQSAAFDGLKLTLRTRDLELIENQTEELSSAYMKIRHGNIL